MALEVTVYTVEARKPGTGSGPDMIQTEPAPYPACDFWTYDYEEAKAYAQDNRLIVIANEYEWADSEPLDDYSSSEEDEEN